MLGYELDRPHSMSFRFREILAVGQRRDEAGVQDRGGLGFVIVEVVQTIGEDLKKKKGMWEESRTGDFRRYLCCRLAFASLPRLIHCPPEVSKGFDHPVGPSLGQGQASEQCDLALAEGMACVLYQGKCSLVVADGLLVGVGGLGGLSGEDGVADGLLLGVGEGSGLAEVEGELGGVTVGAVAGRCVPRLRRYDRRRSR